MERIISAKYDFLFKLLFFDEDDKDIILKKLLKDCIGFKDKEVEKIDLIDRTLDREHKEDKLSALDLNVKLNDGTTVNVEIQVNKEVDYKKRTIYYTSKRFVKQGRKNATYDSLNKAITLNIVDFNMFDYEKYYSTYYFKEETENTVLDDVIRIDFLELQKIKSHSVDKEDKKLLWGKFFSAESREELVMLKEIDKTFEPVITKLERLNAEPSVLTEYEMLQRAEMDKRSMLKNAEERGKRKGELRNKKQTALNLIELGLSDEDISKAVGLTLDEIMKLKSKA